LPQSVRGRVNPIECAILVRHYPDAILTGRDPAFRACWCYRECRTDRVLCGIDANKGRLLSARRNPNAAEP
jgi:hypothetical protein